MTRHVLAAMAALVLLAPAAWADNSFNVRAKAACADASGGVKLMKVTGSNPEIISTCVGVAPTDPTIDLYALTFDSTTRELHVVARCNGTVVCDLTDQIACQTAGLMIKGATDTRAVCSYRMLNFGTSTVEGNLICREREIWSLAKNKYFFHTSCLGSLVANTTPCALGLSSGKPFAPDASVMCPAP